MNKDLQTYWVNTQKPWGTLFYQVVWDQLPPVRAGKVLDFGSGFGLTAAHLSEENQVVAIEPNGEMAENRVGPGNYQQIIGDGKRLKELEREQFDLIVCHNVLEYIPEHSDVLEEFSRLLKPGGYLSIVKHNHPGRIMQKAVFENALEEAISLLKGGDLSVLNFGTVRYYDAEDLLRQMPEMTLEKRFQLERLVYEEDPYRQIAFFHHLLLRKKDR